MCNLGEGIEEKTTEKFILNMYEKGCSLELISDVTKKSIEDIKVIIKKEMLTV